MKMQVSLFWDLRQEQRLSMERYAHGLGEALRQRYGSFLQINDVIPNEIRWPLPRMDKLHKLRNYYDRYVRYGLSARRHQGQINHIVDHSYAHLLYHLDARRSIVTCHDLVLLRLRAGDFGTLPRPHIAILSTLYSMRALHRAVWVVAVSASTRKDLLRFRLCPEERIQVIPDGLEPHFRPITEADTLQEVRRRYSFPEGPTVLHVGHCRFYKNIEGLLRVLAILVKERGLMVTLVKIGAPFHPHQEALLRSLGLGEWVRHLGRVPEADLPALYNLADVLLFPSLHEGFGWPPLEAMACGTPVVASTASSVPEVVGDAGILVDPLDHPGMADAIERILTDSHLRQRLSAQGQSRAARFSWDRTATQIFGLYEQTLETLGKKTYAPSV